MNTGPARDVYCAAGRCQLAEVKGLLGAACRAGGGLCTERGAGGLLAAGHAVIQVVNADYGHVDIAAGRMNEVIAADGDQVAVTGGNQDLALRPGQL